MGLLAGSDYLSKDPIDEITPTSPRIRNVMDLAPKNDQHSIVEPNMINKVEKSEFNKPQSEDISDLFTKTKDDTRDEEMSYKNQSGVGVPEMGVKMTTNHKDDTATSKSISSNETSTIIPKSELISQTRTEIEYLPSNVLVLNLSGASVDDHISSQSLKSDDVVFTNDDYNIPNDTPQGGEISAWQDVVTRSKKHEEELTARMARAMQVSEQVIEKRVFIPPEPPQPKLDVQVVRPINKAANMERNVAKSWGEGPNNSGFNFMAIKNFHSCGNKHCACRRFSTSLRREKDFRKLPPEFEDSSRSKTAKNVDVQDPNQNFDPPLVKEEISNVLQEMSQREMDISLSYSHTNVEESETCSKLPTSVTISTFPTSSPKNSAHSLLQVDDEALGISDTMVTELESTILSLKETDDMYDDEKEPKNKRAVNEDYIRAPGDPYPYSREHFDKWRVPHGKNPIVNDDIPKAKPADTCNSPR